MIPLQQKRAGSAGTETALTSQFLPLNLLSKHFNAKSRRKQAFGYLRPLFVKGRDAI